MADQYTQGLISKKDYEKQLAAIDAEARGRQLQSALDTYYKIARAQAASLALGFGSGKDLQSTGDKITKTKNSLTDLSTDNVKKNIPDDKSAQIKSQEQQDAQDLLQLALSSYDNQLKAQEEYLEHKKQMISDAAEFEKNRIQAGIGTEKDKSKKIALINAQELAQKQTIQNEENKLKRKEAVADKIAALTNIGVNTAVAASKALDNPF